MTHTEAYDYIREHAEMMPLETDFILKTEDGREYFIRMRRDKKDCFYKHIERLQNKGFLASLMWSNCNLVDFVQWNIIAPAVNVSVIAHRKYGEPKLVKPKELKGIKGKSIMFFPKKCNFQYFKTDSDVYILCRDFFSPMFVPPEEDRKLSLNELLKKYFAIRKTEKFIYADSFGSIILRSEAWLKISNYRNLCRKFDSISERREWLKNRFRSGFKTAGFDLSENDFYWNDFIERLYDEFFSE